MIMVPLLSGLLQSRVDPFKTFLYIPFPQKQVEGGPSGPAIDLPYMENDI